jgi:hypothetical protein
VYQKLSGVINCRDRLSWDYKIPLVVMRKIAAKRPFRWLVATASFLAAAIHRLRAGAGKFVPVGYEDETGFHVGASELKH